MTEKLLPAEPYITAVRERVYISVSPSLMPATLSRLAGRSDVISRSPRASRISLFTSSLSVARYIIVAGKRLSSSEQSRAHAYMNGTN